MPYPNVLSSFLAANPYSQYQNVLSGLDPARRRYFAPRYGDIYGRYQGTLAAQALAGEEPTGKFSDFLGNFPFTQEFYGRSPRQRGESPSRYSPAARWLLYR